MRMRSIVPVVALVGLLVMASIGVAGNDESNPPGHGLSKVTAAEPAAREALQILGEERIGVDALPHDIEQAFGKQAAFGMNPELSHVAISNATHAVYVIPARGHVCASLTVGEGANLSCPSIADLAAGKAAPTTVTIETGIAIYGLVPDGVESVSVRTGAPDSIVVSVEGNAYYTVVSAGTSLGAVSYTGPSGAVEFSITDPAIAFEE